MNTLTESLSAQTFDTYEDKAALPIGIVAMVAYPTKNYWDGRRYIKTGSASWALVHEGDCDEELAALVADRAINVSPCPSDPLKIVMSEWNLNKLLTLALEAARKESEAAEGRRRAERMIIGVRLALGLADPAELEAA